jgi:creatinine amidohydrolase
MAPRPYILAEANWKTVKETPYEVAVLPWGATEAHNYHLPYATDSIQNDWIAAEAARQAWEQGAKVVVLPNVPFGVNTGQLDIRLDVNMNPSTQALVLRDVVDARARQGIPKLAVMNGHGGNNFKQMLRELQPQFPAVFLCAFNWYDAARWSTYFEDLGDHAGEMETSIMMHIVPDLVLPLSEAGDGAARKPRLRAMKEGWAWSQRAWTKVTADTGIGDPSRATPEKGRRYLEDATRNIAAFLVELAACDPTNLYE